MKKNNFYCRSMRIDVWMCLLFMFFGLSMVYAGVNNPETSFISQQQRTVTGKVTDVQGTPLPGVSIVIKNTTRGVATDFDGNFEITAQDKDILIFSYVGFVKQEIKVNRKSVINVTLKEETKTLEDVVVVGYGQQKKESLVVSISSVKPKEISTPTRNLTNALAGQVAGLIAVQRSGEPGYDNAEFWIRGISTFAGGSSPLVLVDGVPRSINDVEPDEIETFSVLKDAAATAVYGAEGANGVVLVTTKRGKVEKAKMSLRVEHTYSVPTRLPDFVDSAQYLELFNEALNNDAEASLFPDDLIQKYRDNIDPDLYPNTNWIKEMLDDFTTNQRYSLNVNGGTERARYFVSGALYQESGIFKNRPDEKYETNIGLKRFNLRSNIDIDISKTTKLSVDLSGQYMVNSYPGTGTAQIFKSMLITPPHVFPKVYSDGTIATYPQERDSNMRNPYNLLTNSGYAKEWRTAIQSKVGLHQDLDFLLKGLDYKAFVSFDFDNNFRSKRTFNPTRYHATGRDAGGNLVFSKTASGSPNLSNHQPKSDANKKIYFENSLSYKRKFDDLQLGAMLLFMMKDSQSHDNPLPYRNMGSVGRITLGYADKYFVEANFGYTGSEKFAEGYRFGFFPAVGGAYLLSSESFYPSSLKDYISKVKLRASWGRTGNDKTGGARFLYRPTFKTDAGGFTQGIGDNGGLNAIGNGIYEERVSSPSLSWEIEYKKNFGVDLAFWRGKVQLSVDYFDGRREGILLQRRSVPQIGGFRVDPWANYGVVSNKGVDASLQGQTKVGDFTIGARSTFTFARNKILEYDELPPKYPWLAVTNTRVSENTLYIADRLYSEDDFITNLNPNGTKSYKLKPNLPQSTLGGLLGPGDIKYLDVNGDGVIDGYDRVRGLGNPSVPEIVYGFGFSLQYKSFYINTFFQGVANTSIRFGGSVPQGWYPFAWGVDQSNYRKFALNRWQPGADNSNVLMPRLHSSNSNNANNTVPSTWWLKDGSFLRFKNVEVGVNIPKQILKKARIDAARIYLMGYNLYVWDDVNYFDPESGNSNGGLNYPLPRNFTFGVDLSF